MSGPYAYVYTPNPAYMPSGMYVNTNYQTPQNSPFIPNASLYPSSPYSNPSVGGSPQIPALSLAPPGSPNTVAFPYEPAWEPNVYNVPIRQRRPSYHGDWIPPSSPFVSDSYHLEPDPYSRDRRRSFGGGYYQPVGWNPSTFTDGAQFAPPTSAAGFLLHPWLNAEVWKGDFVLDLTAREFRPLQLNAAGQARPCPSELLYVAATHPKITRLRIICNLIPEWPIDIGVSSGPAWSPGFGIDPSGTQQGITFLDVLIAIHRSLHTRITHADFNCLSLSQERAVTKAYTKRCRAAGAFEATERAQGVKRVDYLVDRKWFRGCILDWEAGVFKLIVG
ncbi:hypothetical protein BDP27DRAFT_1412694 [Rhodocollybia butyracea]|uniref:DUF6699 domain-containing protein n=1 Tax=Rhodocollybia butyracea TaxID=206335 RepID=A0A9P5Q5C4_9AGAR|nr:hypothetical protein BDP27DRAFT_1412694 [Rhodocollybia butyracea]